MCTLTTYVSLGFHSSKAESQRPLTRPGSPTSCASRAQSQVGPILLFACGFVVLLPAHHTVLHFLAMQFSHCVFPNCSSCFLFMKAWLLSTSSILSVLSHYRVGAFVACHRAVLFMHYAAPILLAARSAINLNSLHFLSTVSHSVFAACFAISPSVFLLVPFSPRNTDGNNCKKCFQGTFGIGAGQQSEMPSVPGWLFLLAFVFLFLCLFSFCFATFFVISLSVFLHAPQPRRQQLQEVSQGHVQHRRGPADVAAVTSWLFVQRFSFSSHVSALSSSAFAA